jgi:hypothetical protein
MNAHAHDISCPSQRPLVVPMQWVGGGLRALLTGHLLPNDVANMQFVCGPDEEGVYVVEVLANAAARAPGSTIIQPQLQTAFAQCFLRFWRRAVIEWPHAAPPPETWEWSTRIDGLVCQTRSPDARVSARRSSRRRVRRPLRVVTPRGTSGPSRHESSA